jgi:hypothetical protein
VPIGRQRRIRRDIVHGEQLRDDHGVDHGARVHLGGLDDVDHGARRLYGHDLLGWVDLGRLHGVEHGKPRKHGKQWELGKRGKQRIHWSGGRVR